MTVKQRSALATETVLKKYFCTSQKILL
ncbi:hypothetical protein AAFF39_00665 [Lactococcus garvieae]